MLRRKFLKNGVLGAAAATGFVSACGGDAGDESGAPAVHTQQRIRWRLASSFPRSLDTIYGAAEVLANRVSALTDGQFTIRAFPPPEIVPYDQVLESVQKGTVQMGHSASYYFKGKNPALSFDATVPFGLTTRQYNAWVYHGGGLDLLREVFADFNVRNLPGGNTGVQMGGWFRREIGSLGDLNGLKMRIPGLGGEVMDRLGVTVQVFGGSEIYPALERGAIDAAEWVGPYDDAKLGFHRVARYYYYPGWWEPGPALSFYINQDAWATLPTTYQQALEVAAAEANVGMQANYDAKNPPALQQLLADGVQLRPFPDDVMQAAREHSDALMQEHAAADPAYRRLHDAYTQWRTDAQRWFGTAEQAFANFAFRPSETTGS